MTKEIFDFSEDSDDFYDDLLRDDFTRAQESSINEFLDSAAFEDCDFSVQLKYEHGIKYPDDLEEYYGVEIAPPKKTGPEKVFENVCEYYAMDKAEGQTYTIQVKLVCNICGRSDGWKPIMGMVNGVEQIVAFGCEHEDEMIIEGLPIRKICTVGTTFSETTGHPTGSYLMGSFQCEEVE